MNNISIPIEEMLKKVVKEKISEEIDKEIENKVKIFHREMVSRKDKYISEIMSGIRMIHEQNPMDLSMNYKIIFENIAYLKGDSNE